MCLNLCVQENLYSTNFIENKINQSNENPGTLTEKFETI